MFNIFHILAQIIDCGYTLERHHRDESYEYRSLCFGAKIRK